MLKATQKSQLLMYVKKHGMVRTRDLQTIQVPRTLLKRLINEGELVRYARGVYTTPAHDPTRHVDLAAAIIRAPKAVICLISALEYHEMTTQVPHAVWLMIDKRGHQPKFDHPPIRVVRASGKAFSAGTEIHRIDGVEMRITSPAKTVADCFKYRHRVGQDVAIEALRDCLAQRKATPSDLYEMAKIDRVARIVRPYIEALT